LVRRGEGQNDQALSAKLAAELKYEREATSTSEPEFLQELKNEGIWSVEDKAGNDEVSLHRNFGNEKIKIMFSIADLDTPPVAEEQEELAAAIEGTTPQPPPVVEAESEDGSAGESFPVRTTITIQKEGKGALVMDAIAQDGMFMLDAIAFYKDEKLASDMTVDADWNRRALYMGPEFDALDETLQQEFEGFLEERGIDSNLALFIPDLAEWKEQKEYVSWLDGVKNFIDA